MYDILDLLLSCVGFEDLGFLGMDLNQVLLVIPTIDVLHQLLGSNNLYLTLIVYKSGNSTKYLYETRQTELKAYNNASKPSYIT